MRVATRALISAAAFVVCAAVLDAQTAQTSGRITDPTGSVVPEAKIVITNVDTGVERDSVSNELGYYTIPALAPGNYQVRVQKQGF